MSARSSPLVLVEPSDALPLVGVSLRLRSGSGSDPRGKEGLARLTARALRRGTRELDARTVEDTVDALGAQLSVSVGHGWTHLGGTVVARNVEPFVELLFRLLARPAFRASDLRQITRETLGELTSLCDDDQLLVHHHLRRYAFEHHPYGRSRTGTRASLARIERSDVVRHHAKTVRAGNLVVGMWGAIDDARARRLLDRHLDTLPAGGSPQPWPAPPMLARGRRLLVVDKPGRTQTQVLVAALGPHARDRDHVPLVVANTAFGGLFSSRLVRAIRSERGWSYGVRSGFTQSATRDLWSIWTAPAAADARACIALELDLYERWLARGLSLRELDAAKRYLVKGHAFDIDTAAKRLERRLEQVLFGLPHDYDTGFVEHVRAVSERDVRGALARGLSQRDLVIAVCATARDTLPALRELPGVSRVDVVPFDAL